MEWVRVDTKQNVLDKTPYKASIPGWTVSIHLWNGALFAIDDRCPHRGASLSDGFINDDGYVECWLHSWEYHIQTGKGRSVSMGCLTRFPIKEENDEIFIGTTPLPNE